MHKIKYRIILCFLLFWTGVAHSQVTRSEFRIDFRIGSAVVESNFSDNAQQLSKIVDFLERINQDDAVEIVSVSFCGTTSPEGSVQLNRRLSQKRLTALEQIIRNKVYIPDNLIFRNNYYIPWDDLIRWVNASDMTQKIDIIDIINSAPDDQDASTDKLIQKLRALDNGRAWQLLNRNFFADMRSASAVITTSRKEATMPQPVEVATETPLEILPALSEPSASIDLPAPGGGITRL